MPRVTYPIRTEEAFSLYADHFAAKVLRYHLDHGQGGTLMDDVLLAAENDALSTNPRYATELVRTVDMRAAAVLLGSSGEKPATDPDEHAMALARWALVNAAERCLLGFTTARP